jgi:hypothetical protein
MIAIDASPGGKVDRIADRDAAFVQFATGWNRETAGGRVRIPYEYLLVTARQVERVTTERIPDGIR